MARAVGHQRKSPRQHAVIGIALQEMESLSSRAAAASTVRRNPDSSVRASAPTCRFRSSTCCSGWRTRRCGGDELGPPGDETAAEGFEPLRQSVDPLGAGLQRLGRVAEAAPERFRA